MLKFYLKHMPSGDESGAAGKGGGRGERRSRGRRGRSGGLKKVDERLFKEAVKRAVAQPRLAFYSPIASCVLNYWKSAVPRFSISDFLARIVEKEVARAWPKLYEKAKKEVEKRIKPRRRRGSSV